MRKVLNLNIPKDMFHITDEYMSTFKSLREVNIHNKVSKIDHGAFYNQTSLKKVYFEGDSKLKVLLEGCFENCTSLEKIKLPNELITINKNAFKNCTSIKELRLPDSIMDVHPDAFFGWKEDQVIFSPIKIKKPITCKAQIIYDEEEYNEQSKVVRNKHGLNYYLVTVKCGHVGRDKYIPITFPIQADDKKEAVERVRNFGRVKRDHKDVVLDVRIVDYETYLDQIEINSKDPYLKISRKADQNKIIEEILPRLIKEPNYKRRN